MLPHLRQRLLLRFVPRNEKAPFEPEIRPTLEDIWTVSLTYPAPTTAKSYERLTSKLISSNDEHAIRL